MLLHIYVYTAYRRSNLANITMDLVSSIYPEDEGYKDLWNVNYLPIEIAYKHKTSVLSTHD